MYRLTASQADGAGSIPVIRSIPTRPGIPGFSAISCGYLHPSQPLTAIKSEPLDTLHSARKGLQNGYQKSERVSPRFEVARG